MSSNSILGLRLPDSTIAREATQLLRDTGSELLFRHSMRVYCWAALTARHRGLAFDPELLYAGAMFHDLGLTARFHASALRFEVDGANAARDFLKSHGIPETDVHKVWTAIALHTTPGIPEFLHPEAALLHVGAGMDVAGRSYDQFTDEEREAVVALTQLVPPAGKERGVEAQGRRSSEPRGEVHRPGVVHLEAEPRSIRSACVRAV